MRDFIGENDTNTFEGWLNYQAVDGSALAPAELAMWRSLYDESRRSSSDSAPVGLMKLGPLAQGEHRYAVALMPATDDTDWALGNYFALHGNWKGQLEAIVGRHVSLEAILPDTPEDAAVRRTGSLLWARDQ